jgi:hypothetical protein
MNEETIQKPAPAPQSPAQTRRFRIGAAMVIAIAVAIILWLVFRDSGSNSSTPSNVSAVSVGQIRNLAASVAHPIFWVGPKQGDTYELTRTSNGSIYVRYLPSGVKLGAKEPYLTIATYPFPGAYPALQKVASQRGSTPVKLSHGGLAVISKVTPKSVHAAYPGVNYQIEIFDPNEGEATTLAIQDQLAALGKLSAGAATLAPTTVSIAGLRSIASNFGHSVYWIGAKKGYTYEVTRTASGRIYLRYLPPGAKVGTKKPYLTVATYPYRRAFQAVEALSKSPHTTSVKVTGGGLAVIDTKHPKSIHLAYPRGAYQIELFDPSPTRARQIVSSDQVTTIG